MSSLKFGPLGHPKTSKPPAFKEPTPSITVLCKPQLYKRKSGHCSAAPSIRPEHWYENHYRFGNGHNSIGDLPHFTLHQGMSSGNKQKISVSHKEHLTHALQQEMSLAMQSFNTVLREQ